MIVPTDHFAFRAPPRSWRIVPGLIIGVLAASFALTGWYRRLAMERSHFDVPNSRSSHTVATPRGGGVAIAVSTILGFLILGWAGYLVRVEQLGLCSAATLVALVGYLDDRRDVRPRWRLVGHFAAAAVLLVCFGGAPPVSTFGTVLHLGWLGAALAGFYLVWMLNLTNFMDGIDGIAAVEAVTVCVCMAGIDRIVAPAADLWMPPLVLASGTLGFLIWNWPPAKIFMGDVGSGLLGFLLGALSLQAAWVSPGLLWPWLIMLGVFVVDATVTLVRRFARGERVSEAHRSHAYQQQAIRLGAHRPVTIAVAVINLVWLLPIAVAVAIGWLDGLAGVVIAYAPLIWLAVRLGAGTGSIEAARRS